MTIGELILTYCNENGYDGLCHGELECGCAKDDLFPCGEAFEDCEFGYKRPSPKGSTADFWIMLGKPGPDEG